MRYGTILLLLYLKWALSKPINSLQRPTLEKSINKTFNKLRPKSEFHAISKSLNLFIFGGGQGINTESSLYNQPLGASKILQTLLLKHEFIIGMISAVTLAKLFPQVG